jgi:hypothetical protein
LLGIPCIPWIYQRALGILKTRDVLEVFKHEFCHNDDCQMREQWYTCRSSHAAPLALHAGSELRGVCAMDAGLAGGQGTRLVPEKEGAEN